MKRLLIIAIVLLFEGCTRGNNKITVIENAPADMVIIEIDSCEYLRANVSGGYTYTHKGNCKNPIHYKTKPQ